ncbi:MAG: 1-deoxy-D-xylulose-5-phosphate synthase [Candidatus Omnitrophota bacterium]
MMSILQNINSPADLKRVSVSRLPGLCSEIRELILSTVLRTGGHLASSLGAVEIAVSLHYCLNTPRDALIWDVGHQAYAHKILTGRRDAFSTLRQEGGISGFPLREESPYDLFSAGHASSALSLALGLACARDLSDRSSEKKIAAVIGDGSLTGGMCFEALNQAGHLQKDLLVVFNTNEMSIAPSVGALSNYLNKIISLPIYNRFRDALQEFMLRRLPRGKRLVNLARKFEEGLKNILVPGIFFEELGFRYIGPLDGHNVGLLVRTLRHLLTFKGPVLLHIVTQKGKGYAAAENSPEDFHSVRGASTGERKKEGRLAKEEKALSYTDVFSRKLVSLAEENNKLVAITAAMPKGTGLDKFARRYPRRFFDVGIAEGHALGFAAGLARDGFRPVVAIYSTFLQRAFDQIIEDVSLQRLPVVLAIDRAGIVGEDGVTHQGIFDIAYLGVVPDMVIMCPCCARQLEAMLEFALSCDGPVALRYPKAAASALSSFDVCDSDVLRMGKSRTLMRGRDVAVVALGSMVSPALEAAVVLQKQGVKAEIIDACFAKPLDRDLLLALSRRFDKVVTVEEGVAEGGFGSAVAGVISNKVKVHKIGLPCEFIPHSRREDALARYGLDSKGIAKRILSL